MWSTGKGSLLKTTPKSSPNGRTCSPRQSQTESESRSWISEWNNPFLPPSVVKNGYHSWHQRERSPRTTIDSIARQSKRPPVAILVPAPNPPLQWRLLQNCRTTGRIKAHSWQHDPDHQHVHSVPFKGTWSHQSQIGPLWLQVRQKRI